MKNQIKKIADDLHSAIKDPGFESFIAEQILSSKSLREDEPFISITHQDVIIDVWKKGSNFEIVKSVLPCASKKAGKDFRKLLKKKEIVEEISKLITSYLD
jgi:hypothetical protein